MIAPYHQYSNPMAINNGTGPPQSQIPLSSNNTINNDGSSSKEATHK